MYVFIIEIYLFKENHLLSVEKLGIDFVEHRKLEIEYVDGVYWYFVNRESIRYPWLISKCQLEIV